MRAWRLLLCALPALLAPHCIEGKRFDPSMVDPLMRRSSLDKNFMRFGRSSPAFTEDDETDENHDPSPGAESNKEDNIQRSIRGKDNFIRFGKSMIDDSMRYGRGKQDNFMRFGRARNDNFMRFGRGKQDNYMRFGRGKQDNYMRFGRGKQDNYMRFGRGKQDNYMRFGRGKQDNFMRFGRGKQDNYMRFGRGKQDNFMRFGRGKQDNFMRFGRVREDNYMRFGKGFVDLTNLPDVFDKGKVQDSDFQRLSRGKQDNFMRFGKDVDIQQDNNIPIAIRSVNPNSNSNFIRFGRARPDNFMRFGKSVDDNSSLQLDQEPEDPQDKFIENFVYSITPDEEFTRETKAKDLNLIRLGRHPPNKNDAFMRFGRSQDKSEDSPQDLIPQRLKRSPLDPYPLQPQGEVDDHFLVPIVSLPEDFEDDSGSPLHQDDDGARKKRSLSFGPSTPSPFDEDDGSNDYIYTKLQVDSQAVPEYQSSLLSAGLPNIIVGPELSLLPALNPPSTMLKSDRPGDKSFLRLG